jgi:hypothetical protein
MLFAGYGGVLFPKAESACNYRSYCKDSQLDAITLTSSKCWSYLSSVKNECICISELWSVLLLPLL